MLMRRKRLFFYFFLAIITGGGGSLLFFRNVPSREFNRAAETVTAPSRQSSVKSLANLYFADKNNVFLIAESQTLPNPGEPATFGRIIIEALIKGPREGLMRTVPEGTTLRAIYVTDDGTAYADISQTVSENHPGGCNSELLTIYSIVNSLILNITEIESVQILIGGREAMTLSGHIDLRYPFKANMLLIR